MFFIKIYGRHFKLIMIEKKIIKLFLMLLLYLGAYLAQLYFWLGLDISCLPALLLLAFLRIYASFIGGKKNNKM